MALITQPRVTTIESLSAALTQSATVFDVAVAYATFSGVIELLHRSRLRHLPRTVKRFLVGIDWFRSEPSALDTLSSLPSSEVRIVDGAHLVKTENCHPRRTYHPKAYMIADKASTLLVGSANLSLNGLARSVELSLTTTEPADVALFRGWFGAAWADATSWTRVRNVYTERYVLAKRREFVLTDDDDLPDEDAMRIQWVTPERLRLMRAAQNLWCDVGRLHNRDPQGLPGTDLQFTQMTRVFFGHPARVVPGNTHLLDIPLSKDGARPETRPMVYNASSSMDRLSLPIPGLVGWPAVYDDRTLLFTKAADGSFRVSMAEAGDKVRWRRASQQNGFSLTMRRNNREWGVF